jgi:hypothetical protein
VTTLVERWWNIPPIPTSQTSLTWAYGGVGGVTESFSDSVRRLEACTAPVPVLAGRPHRRAVGHVPPYGSTTRA